MYRVLIDTTKRFEKSVRLLKDKDMIAERFGDIDVVVAIDEVLKESSLDKKDVDEFAANPGPGSFTGIKTGLTIANVLNWALGKKSLEELQKPHYGSEPNISKKNPPRS